MYELEHYLNIIGEYFCETNKGKFTALGILVRKETDNNCVIFRGRIPAADLKCLEGSLNLFGTIDKMKISLLNSSLNLGSCVSEPDYVNVELELDRIVIGDHYKGDANIRCVSTELQALNHFFATHISPHLEKDYLEAFTEANPPLTANNEFGTISIQPFLASSFSTHQTSVWSVPTMKYSFKDPKTLDAAIEHIASLRNLFTFFADGYIDFDSLEYTFNSDLIPRIKSGRVSVYLNHKETINEIDAPFLLTRRSVEKDFEKIVRNWLEFYQNSVYIPSLFFEIITNQSKGINAFLNLAQAVEIYSTYFRDVDAKAVRNLDPSASNKRDPQLKHRLIEIFSYLQTILGITEVEKESLAQIISDNRNFYTHYKKTRDEPDFRVVSRMIVFLRFVLLALIYKHIGVEDQAIQSCKRAGMYTTMDETIQIILANKPASKTVLES